MTVSRYRNTAVVSGSYYGTFDIPYDALSKISCYTIRTTAEDRLDSLAHQYLGAGEYWWVIALLNNIQWVFDFTPGELLKIPQDVQDVLRYF